MASDGVRDRRSGSSPHTRGLRPPVVLATYLAGIIPAHAGFTRHWVVGEGLAADHPRTRGVYVRGDPSSHEVIRIIPAHAGFTAGAPSRGL